MRFKARICKRVFRSLVTRGSIAEIDRGKVFPAILWLHDFIKLIYISTKVTHSFGSRTIPLDEEEAVVLCLVRDGELWIEEYLEHYFGKGFKHIVFLDTGSTDDTLRIAKKFANVTVLETTVPFKDHDLLFRRYLVRRFSKGRWSLMADIDEFWDYPHSDKISLTGLLGYLKRSGANAMISQTLDMFMPNLPSGTMSSLKTYNYYDISCVKKDALTRKGGYVDHGFFSRSSIPHEVCFYRGGIRAQIFGMEDIWLTKMPLIYYDRDIEVVAHQHFSNNVTIADVTSVLFHYKFTHTFKEKIQEALQQKQYFGESIDYRRYAEGFIKDPNPSFKKTTAKKFKSTEELVSDYFLVVSSSYVVLCERI